MFHQRSTLQGSPALAAARGEDARFDNEHSLRYGIGVAVGLVATLLLFLLMQAVENAVSAFETGCVAFNRLALR